MALPPESVDRMVYSDDGLDGLDAGAVYVAVVRRQEAGGEVVDLFAVGYGDGAVGERGLPQVIVSTLPGHNQGVVNGVVLPLGLRSRSATCRQGQCDHGRGPQCSE